MRLIGLCGRSGSGKNECGRIISDMGIKVIDSDEVYRSLTKKGSLLLTELAVAFGDEIIGSDGELDRKILAGMVYKNNLFDKLNKLTHTHIIKKTLELSQELSAKSRGGLVVILAPLLFESGFYKSCEKKVCVISSDADCIKRLQLRDGLTAKQAKDRLSRQKDNLFLIKNCDYMIENNGGFDRLKKQTEAVFLEILGETKI